MTLFSPSYILLHGAFARPARKELMEVAALRVGAPAGDGLRSLVRCEIPDTPQDGASGDDGSGAGVSEEENRNAPTADELFADLNNRFGLADATVVMWSSMAYRFHVYARERDLSLSCFQHRVIDLQAAVVLYYDLKTAQCKDPRSVARLLELEPGADAAFRGTLSYVHAMNAILQKLLADGWTPEATPAAVTPGCDIGEDAEEMRTDRWEQIRERQNNLGIERRPAPDVTPAFIILDGEFVSVRHERFHRLIEVALMVAYRKERGATATYELAGKSFSSLVQLLQIKDTHSRAWEITAINPEEVRRAPALPRVMAGMIAAAPWDRGVLITWGPDDAKIITQNCVETGIPSPITEVPLVDLQRAFCRFYEIGSPQIGLERAAAMLNVDTGSLDLHRALADVQVTWEILQRMLADGWTPQWRPWHRRAAAQGM